MGRYPGAEFLHQKSMDDLRSCMRRGLAEPAIESERVARGALRVVVHGIHVFCAGRRRARLLYFPVRPWLSVPGAMTIGTNQRDISRRAAEIVLQMSRVIQFDLAG